MGNWKEKALETQQELYERLGDRKWDRIQSGERWALESKILFAIFGEPTYEFRDTIFCREKQYEEITKMRDLIYEVRGSTDVFVAFLFLIGKGNKGMFQMPVFRVMKRSGDAVFMDVLGHVYESWSDFMENNRLPECEFSFPRSGVYEADDDGKVLASFAQSPSSSLGSRLPNNMDGAHSVATVAPANTGIGSLTLTAAGPITTAATLRGAHPQTLESNEESSYPSTVGIALCEGIDSSMKEFIAMNYTVEILIKSQMGSLDATNVGFETADEYDVDKYLMNKKEINDEEEPRTLEVLQFMNSALFFTNSTMLKKTASAIMQQVQGETLNNFRADQMSRRERALDRLMKTSNVEGRMINNAEIIKGITYVRSKEESFGMTAWEETASTERIATWTRTSDSRLHTNRNC